MAASIAAGDSAALVGRADLTASAAGASAALVDGADLTASAAGATGDRGLMRTASATALTRERTAKLLLDVPGLEFDTPIQIHSKAGGDVERLEKQDDGRVLNRADPCVARPPQRLQIAPGVGIRVRRQPNLQKEHADEQCEFGRCEGLSRGARDAAMARGELADPSPQFRPAQTLELNDGLREGPGRR